MTQEELKQITSQSERRTIEYKEAWSELPSNLFETVCAFLNRDGGVIVLGAHNDGTITEGGDVQSTLVQVCVTYTITHQYISEPNPPSQMMTCSVSA